MMWMLLLYFVVFVKSQDPCPTSKTPTDLAAVSVWVNNSTDIPIYRISDEDLSDYQYIRSSADRDNFIVLLARNAGKCDGLCSIKISTNERNSDKVINHQENALGSPPDETDLVDDFYCGRTMGSCGADVPLFKYTNIVNGTIHYAYSLDSKAEFPGMIKDPLFQCFGWADGGSVVHPTSTEQQCMRMTSIENGKITYSAPGSGAYPIGTTAVLTCHTNFAATGQSSVMCTKDGWAPKRGLGNCIVQRVSLYLSTDNTSLTHVSSECTAMSKVEHGQNVYSSPGKDSRYPPGTTVTVLCNLGYVPVGETLAKCDDGVWNGKTLTTCHSIATAHCLPMLPPANGKIIYTAALNGTAYGEGTMAELQCNSDYSVQGTAKTVCEKRAWQEPLGGCVKTRQAIAQLPCVALVVANGMVTYLQNSITQQYSSGTIGTLLCNLGYTATGSSTSTCTNGLWTPAIGICTLSGSGGGGIQCGDMVNPLNGAVSYSLTNGALHPTGAVATLTCNLGYTLSGGFTSICSNGIWSPATLGTCTSSGLSLPGVSTGGTGVQCGDMMNPLNGVVSYSLTNGVLHPTGSIATLKCNVGYTLVGALSSSCSNGAWSPANLGSCNYQSATGAGGLECANPVVYNGQITYSTSNLDATKPVGTTATLTCNQGTMLSGSGSAICQNGAWTPPFGVCTGTATGTNTGQSCIGMLPPLFATVSYTSNGPFGPFPSGTVAKMSCSSGNPSGVVTATCQNGQWNPTSLGVCSTASLDQPTTTTPAGPTTPSPPCYAALAPLGGTITYSAGGPFGPFNQSTTATLSCTVGSAQGPMTSTCTSGSWKPALGTCSSTILSSTSCPFAPLLPFGASATYGGTSSGPFPNGSTLTLTCPTGQALSGNSVATCLNGVWSSLGACLPTTGF